MKNRPVHWNTDLKIFLQPDTALVVQAPLPGFNTWPRISHIKGQASGGQGPSPLAPPEDPAND